MIGKAAPAVAVAIMLAGCDEALQPSPVVPPLVGNDLEVTEVLVDGQGSITRGGTIRIPAEGVTLTLKGRYQLVNTPVQRLFIEAYPFSSTIFGTGAAPRSGGAESETTWSVTRTRWVPCSGGPVDLRCVAVTESIQVEMEDIAARAGAGEVIVNRLQPWVLHYLLAPDCCRYPFP